MDVRCVWALVDLGCFALYIDWNSGLLSSVKSVCIVDQHRSFAGYFRCYESRCSHCLFQVGIVSLLVRLGVSYDRAVGLLRRHPSADIRTYGDQRALSRLRNLSDHMEELEEARKRSEREKRFGRVDTPTAISGRKSWKRAMKHLKEYLFSASIYTTMY